jgi:hypothetical protein
MLKEAEVNSSGSSVEGQGSVHREVLGSEPPEVLGWDLISMGVVVLFGRACCYSCFCMLLGLWPKLVVQVVQL